MDRRRRTCNGKAVSAKPALGPVTPARVPPVPGLGETEEKAIGCADDLGALAQVGVGTGHGGNSESMIVEELTEVTAKPKGSKKCVQYYIYFIFL